MFTSVALFVQLLDLSTYVITLDIQEFTFVALFAHFCTVVST